MFKKFLILISIILIIICCCSCSQQQNFSKEQNSNKIIALLEDKYGCVFIPYTGKAGEDFDTLDGLWFTSVDFPDYPFEAKLENDKLIEDYIKTIMEYKRAEYIDSMIKEKNIDSVSFCSLSCDDRDIPIDAINMDIKLFMKTYCSQTNAFMSYTLLKETDSNKDKLDEVAVTLDGRLSKDVTPKTQSTYVFSIPEKDWETAVEMFRENPSYDWVEKITNAKRF